MGTAFRIDLESGEATPMQSITLAALGLQERKDLQRWVTRYPELIAPDLLLVTTEFDRWEIRDQRVADRLDALFLDTTGAPVVAELKRDRATDTVDMQALKYAAYCSQLTFDELAEEFASHHSIPADEARQQLLDHAPSLEDGGPRKIKIRLVAGSFGPAVTSLVLWLQDYDVDIGCVEVSVQQVPGGREAFLSSRQLLPLPEAENYLVRRRRKEIEEERSRDAPADWTWESYAEKFPADKLEIARELWDQLTRYVAANDLPWTPVFRSWWLGYQRPGGYYVPVIDLRSEQPIGFAVKLPDDPARLGLENPYPNLQARWKPSERQWTWDISSLEQVPDVRAAVEMSRQRQPATGPMPRPLAAISLSDSSGGTGGDGQTQR